MTDKKWVAGWLAVTVLTVLGSLFLGSLFRGRSHPAPAPATSRVSADARAQLPPVADPSGQISKAVVENRNEVEICGLGKVPLDAGDPFAAGRYIGALSKPAAQRWLAALLGSNDYRARAAGLILEGKITDGVAMEPIAEPTRDALVRLAVSTSDPSVYAMAVSACNTYVESANGACQQISLSDWARMDADNATPWLLLAGQARAKNDMAAAAGAFGRAAQAHRTNTYDDSLSAFADPELPKDVTALERWYFSIELIGIESATVLPQYSVASKYCSIEAVQDSSVRQQCDAIAELLVNHGTTLLGLGAGENIGARTGWSAQRLNQLAQERNALMQAIMQTTASATPASADDHDLWSCKRVELGNIYMRHRVQLGEIGAARDALERSGESVQELAQKQNEFIENIRRDARPH
jgi:hypothetical protein